MIKEYKRIIIDLITLSMPILAGNLSQILIGFTDTIIAGHYSTLALGAISVASAIVMTTIIGGIGLVLGVSPTIANLRGQNTPCKRYFKLTILFSLIVSIPFFIILRIILFNLDYIGLSPDLIEPSKQYIDICSYSIFPSIVFVAIKEFLQAYEKVVFTNFLMFLMVILNLILNYVLTFGYDFSFFSIPSLGIVGLSIATLLTKTLVAVFLLLYCIPLFKKPFINCTSYIKDLIKVGCPISCAIFFEFLGFNLTAVLIGKFSSLFAAVHNIILCIGNFTFMIVLSISNAASIKIGYYNGKKDINNIRKYSIANWIITLVICLVSFILLGTQSGFILSIFSKDTLVISLSKKILKFAIAFLFLDGIQAASVGILKGLKDTKIIAKAMVCAYAVIAIPVGCYLAYYKGLILEGFWSGLVLALFFAAIITTTRAVKNLEKIKKTL